MSLETRQKANRDYIAAGREPPYPGDMPKILEEENLMGIPAEEEAKPKKKRKG